MQVKTAAAIGSSTLCSDNTVWFVVLMAQLLGLVIALLLGPDAFWLHLALASLFCHWVGLVGLACLCWLQRRGVDGQTRRHWALYWGVLSALGILALAAGHRLYGWLFPLQAVGSPETVLMQVAAVLIFSGLLLRYWYLQNALTLRQQATTQAELDALQARLNPHFLFNALNSVAALIRQDPQRAEQAVEHLADLMRASLRSQQSLITLREELDLTRAYVWLEQARFGDRLQIAWDVDDRLLEERVPMLSLQPLVENAVKHGIAPSTDGGTVHIDINAAVRVWMIRVKNPLPDTPAAAGNRFALSTLRARGESLLGADFQLSTRLEADHFVAQITLRLQPDPVRKKKRR
ncbi:MAG: histidine kinase [Natronospirillum sp.]|uniref:sensor histidine kinase n=1 Tax=Natronospirillum sp. TaxID=2812955 RepID=UPI0025ED35A8|nr:histidine kinase [Natronospirillum sp.]MCH8551756.1 histidine kinase [Natronospirillum sp.]